MAEVVTHVEARYVGDRAGEFHTGGSATDEDEIEGRVPTMLEFVPFGEFEGQQHAAANLGRVLYGL